MTASDNGLGSPFWADLHGLGGWIPISDVVRAVGFNHGGMSGRVAGFLEKNGREVRKEPGPNGMWWMRKADCRLLPEFFAQGIRKKIKDFGEERNEALRLLDKPEFDGMELPEIFEALAADWTRTMNAIAEGGSP